MHGQQNKNRNSAPEAKSTEDQGWSSNCLTFQIKIITKQTSLCNYVQQAAEFVLLS